MRAGENGGRWLQFRKKAKHKLTLKLIGKRCTRPAKLRKEQLLEKEVEARVKGLSLTEIKVQVAPCEKDERVFCNYYSTSIADYHRSCPNCSYDLCLSCCKGLRECSLPGHKGQFGINVDTPKILNALMQWRASVDGSICCPPEELDGCGNSLLQLKSINPEDLFVELEEKVKTIVAQVGGIFLMRTFLPLPTTARSFLKLSHALSYHVEQNLTTFLPPPTTARLPAPP
ncbi:hypothetical protein KSP39_PZI015888 [Platanthera zijinensis]|uniref:Uncharacterized protein n=1 Tax=Platanthera zijinensis TaxID=2320716 RepID=A0AAP0B917_9ASPA